MGALFLALAVLTSAAVASPRTVTVGVPAHPPKILPGDRGEPSGILGEMLQEIARRERWTLQPVRCDWSDCLQALQDGRLDLLPDVPYSEGRALVFDFHQTPSLHSWSIVFQPEGGTLDTVTHLQGKRIAVIRASSQQAALKELLDAFGLSADFRPVEHYEEAFAALRRGDVDAAVANRFYGNLNAHRFGLVASPIVFQPTQRYYAAPKGRNAELLQAIETHMARWVAEPGSPYFRALDHWTVRGDAAGAAPPWVWWSVGLLVLGLAAALYGRAELRRQIAEKSRRIQAGREELERSEQRYRHLAENSTDWIWSSNLEGVCTYSNARVTDCLGVDRDTFVGSLVASRVHPDDADVYRQTGARAIATRTGWQSVPMRWRHANGETRTLESSGQPLFDENGELVGFQGIDRDVTERVKLEQQLADHREELERLVAERTQRLAEANRVLARQSLRINDLFDHAPCGYHSMSADGVLIAVNQTELDMLGYTREEFLGRHITEFMTPRSREQFAERFEYFKRTGHVRDLDYDFVRKDGTTLPVLVSADIVRDDKGQFASTRSTVTDNRERKAREGQIAQLQAELAKRAEAAEAANVAKSAFLANMSHEIRTPINTIVGMSHLIRGGGLTGEQAGRLDKLDAATDHLLAIINAILDLSKIEADKLKLACEGLRVETLIDGVVSMVQYQAQHKGLHVSTEVVGQLPADLCGDATRLRQALINYVQNAIKFTDSGSVIVRVRVVEATERDALVRFEVEDTGIGIDPDVVDKLFAPFEQGDSAATRRFGGSGLGLAITRKLARLMGGDAGAHSLIGVGSTFWFTARLTRSATPVAAPAHPSSAAEALLRERSGQRILLVEDEPVNREIAATLLKSANQSVDTACDGAEAVTLASQRRYDLILMDMQMPGVDGLEATRRIRQSGNGARVPIVALTANAFAEDRQRCMDAGMDDFLVKPVRPAELYTAVLRWLQQHHDRRRRARETSV